MLRGTSIYLRAVDHDDLERCHQWMNDPAVIATLQVRYPQSRTSEREWLDRMTDPRQVTDRAFAICLPEGDRHIGNCGLHHIQWENRVASLGIAIGATDCWHKGYGTDATRTLCRLAFQELNLHKVNLTVYAFNSRAERVYERIGFRREGVLREELFRDGKYHDIMRMGLLAREFDPGAASALSTSETT